MSDKRTSRQKRGGAPPASSGSAYATRQRKAIAEVMRDLERFRSAQEIHAELKRRGRDVGLTTVYRHLNRLAGEGGIDVLRTPDGNAVYRLCGVDSHHHHLTCRNCGRTVEVEAPQVERWAARVGKEARFRDVSHTVEIFGVCEACAG